MLLAISAVAGSTNTGAVDNVRELADVAEREGLWLHVDAAYGGAARLSPKLEGRVPGLERADSVTVDPHKWLYAPVEAGCLLVRNGQDLLNAFSYQPAYYNFQTDGINYFNFGPQNSRGFRAMSAWRPRGSSAV